MFFEHNFPFQPYPGSPCIDNNIPLPCFPYSHITPINDARHLLPHPHISLNKLHYNLNNIGIQLEFADNRNTFRIIIVISQLIITPTRLQAPALLPLLYKSFCLNTSAIVESTTYTQASKLGYWRKAMSLEIDALEQHYTWVLVDLPR